MPGYGPQTMVEGILEDTGSPAPAVSAGRLAGVLLAERDRWLLWTPVGLGVGIALYFALAVEPAPFSGALAYLVSLVFAALVRHRPVWLVAAIAALAVSTGFGAAQFRAFQVAAPVLVEDIRFAIVTGRVVESEVRDNGRRLVLDRVRIAGLDPEATPARVRISLRGAGVQPIPGEWVRLRGSLSPPGAPAAPGAFDFARQAYFKRLGGLGFAFGPAQVIDPPAGEGAGGWMIAIGRFRQHVTARLRAGLEGQAGAVAAALLTGERGAIAKDVLAAVRDAGLAHLLAISGLHIGLFAGILFFAARALLAACEPLALSYPIKKWAACAALAATAFYLLLSGATIPTQRAFLMGALVIVAILLDRTGVSMRSVAWAAVAVLLVQPESLLGASFQMSFAAMIALVAAFEWYGLRRSAWAAEDDASRRLWRYVAGVALVTVIASLATAPFAAYNFNRFAVYGLAANLLAVPTTALWIMPWGIAALALMPLGLETWALAPMGWGIDAVIAVARGVSSWPGAVRLLPAMPTAGIVAAAAGGLWLCLWRRPWRGPGALVFAAALASPAVGDAPDVLVDGKGKLFAVRTDGGALALSSRRAARYTAGIWLRRNGQSEPAPWPGEGGRLRCDGLGCLYRVDGRVVALVSDGPARSPRIAGSPTWW